MGPSEHEHSNEPASGFTPEQDRALTLLDPDYTEVIKLIADDWKVKQPHLEVTIEKIQKAIEAGKNTLGNSSFDLVLLDVSGQLNLSDEELSQAYRSLSLMRSYATSKVGSLEDGTPRHLESYQTSENQSAQQAEE